MVKKKSINNLFLENLLDFDAEIIKKRFKLNGYVYTNYHNRIEREHPSIKCKTKQNLLYRISKPFTVKADLDQKGIVYKIE